MIKSINENLKPWFAKHNLPWLGERTIFLTLHGSQAYGTNTPESDIDVKGLCIPPSEYYHGFMKQFEQAEGKEPYDMVIYGLQKFFHLASDCNPNIIEVLNTDPEDWVIETPIFRRLWEKRDLFLSRKARFTFSGYAISQLKRIKSHKKWLLEPPDHMPTREEFGLPTDSKMSQSDLGATAALIEANVPLDKNVMRLFHMEQNYQAAKRNWDQYQNWKSTRNEKRASLEAKFGYDCYLDDTEFLTNRGWLLYDEVNDEDQLATINQKSGEIEFQRSFERVKKPYSGEILHFETQDSLCSVTPNHRMFVSPVSRNRKNGFTTKYRLSEANWQFMRADELLSGNRSYFHTLITTCKWNDNEEISNDLLMLVGAYASEGCVGKRLVDGTPSVLRFSQKESGRQQVFLDTLCETTNMRKTPVVREDKGFIELVYTLADRQIAKQIVEWCGEYSEKKRLPQWINTLSSEQARLLLDVLVAGDGIERSFSSIYYTKSKLLADDVQTLGLIAGRVSKIWGPYSNGMYHVYLGEADMTDTLVATENVHVTKEMVINRHIVCFSVPNETLVTRRKGKVAMHGNTKHAMHLVRLMRMCREILTDGKVLVKRPDAEELKAIRFGAWTYEKLIEWADAQEAEMEELYHKSPLPKEPRRVELDKLCQEITEEALKISDLRVSSNFLPNCS